MKDKMVLSYIQISVSLLKIISILLSLQCLSAFDPKEVCSDIGSNIWLYVPCNEYFKPKHCFDSNMHEITLDEFDRCGPAYVPLEGRNYYLDRAGRAETFKDNKKAIRRIKILPKALRDVSVNSTKTTVFGMELDSPIGISPVGFQKYADPEGELGIVSGVKDRKTIYVLSSYVTSLIEDVAKRAEGGKLHLWMQLYLFKDRKVTIDIARRAEKNGFKALVITADTYILPGGLCKQKGTEGTLPPGSKLNFDVKHYASYIAHNGTFKDVEYFSKNFKIPVVVKGILRASDAIQAIQAGAKGIWVSTHGGRTLDYDPASIDALPYVVDTVKSRYPDVEIFVDSGFRNGGDVLKGLARGAKMVFIGRPFTWGLAVNGSSGVKQVMDIITSDFEDTMTLSGNTCLEEITRNTILPPLPSFH